MSTSFLKKAMKSAFEMRSYNRGELRRVNQQIRDLFNNKDLFPDFGSIPECVENNELIRVKLQTWSNAVNIEIPYIASLADAISLAFMRLGWKIDVDRTDYIADYGTRDIYYGHADSKTRIILVMDAKKEASHCILVDTGIDEVKTVHTRKWIVKCTETDKV